MSVIEELQITDGNGWNPTGQKVLVCSGQGGLFGSVISLGSGQCFISDYSVEGQRIPWRWSERKG